MGSRISAVLFSLLIVSCSGRAVRESEGAKEAGQSQFDDRRAALLRERDWVLEGRLSIDDGQEGGSGRVSWQVNGNTSRIDFHAAMGRGAWRLVMNDQGAVLETADGRVLREPTVNTLLQKEMGWLLPVDALAWWARGLAAPDGEQRLELDADGLAGQIMQQGWTVSYRRYSEFAGRMMPVRLNANKGKYRIKLAVSEWRFGKTDH